MGKVYDISFGLFFLYTWCTRECCNRLGRAMGNARSSKREEERSQSLESEAEDQEETKKEEEEEEEEEEEGSSELEPAACARPAGSPGSR